MKRVPTLDSYMPVSSSFSGYDPQMEGLAKKHIEVYRRKKNRSGSPVLIQRNVNNAVEDRMSKWEAEKGSIHNNQQYVSARLEYLEDIIRLQRDTIERPLRREKADYESKIEIFQSQLNVVAGQMEVQAKRLTECKGQLHQAEQKVSETENCAKEERERLSNLHDMHLNAEKRANEAELERVKQELRVSQSLLESHQSTLKPSSPLVTRNPWKEENAKLEALIEELSDTISEKDKEVHHLTEKVKLLEGDTRINDDTPEHTGLLAAWETLSRFITHTDRQKAGIRTAVSQLQLTTVNRAPRKPKPVPARPLPGDPLLKWVEAMSTLAAVASEEGTDGGSYSVSVLLKVIEAHKSSLDTAAEKEKEAMGMKGLDRQRLVEIERDRDEERRLFNREREKLKAEMNALRKNHHELQLRSNKMLATIDTDAQTDASLGVLAETYTQTAWDGSDPVMTRLKSDVDVKQHAIQDLTRSLDSRDNTIRSLREQRERFLSFVFDNAVDDHHHTSGTRPHTHTSPRRVSELAQLSTFDFVTGHH
eukprot:TRINITY_DN9117_c0_g1_i2.p1 TRINITY_DN9117_c0_g1~~TRINITY_DN9117_c0_g1_i2.p1  ORF type:complete len:535 (+),score=162.58 TRINITY_DN9117_c0_g1_i2:218-1822(+)